jgi:hypothetical protein
MIFAKPVLTEDLYIVHKEEFAICAICTFGERRSIFIRDKTTFSSERMLRKDYYRRGSVAKEKKSLPVGLKGLDAKTN